MHKYSQQSSDHALTLMATLPDIQTPASNHIIKRGNGLCLGEMSNQVFAMSTRGVEKVSKKQCLDNETNVVEVSPFPLGF